MSAVPSPPYSASAIVQDFSAYERFVCNRHMRFQALVPPLRASARVKGALRPGFKQSFSIVFQTTFTTRPLPSIITSPHHFFPLIIRPK